MDNLIEQAARWLQSEECRTGGIQERTSAVISSFRSFVMAEKEEIHANTGQSIDIITNIIDETARIIRQILAAYLRGNHQDALRKTHEMMRSIKFDKLEPGIPMYKCRENSRLFHLSQDEMFHIPYDKRSLIGNQRFSLSGLPCLYLGGSSYICWEELGRKDLNSSNYCGYSLRIVINVFDLMLPSSITKSQQIQRIVLALACSLAAKRDSIFKPEYILPQCILHSLINRSFYTHSQFCVRYYSSHMLNGDADYFVVDYFNDEALQRYVNYVFPAASSQEEGFSEVLRRFFNQTTTISLLHETILDPSSLICVVGEDAYLSSQFGLIDSILDKKLGFKPKRKEGALLLVNNA